MALTGPPIKGWKACAKIVKVEIAGNESTIANWLSSDLTHVIGSNVEVVWIDPAGNDGESGIVAVHMETPNGVVRID